MVAIIFQYCKDTSGGKSAPPTFRWELAMVERFDRLPRELTGDSDPHGLFYAVGSALSGWEKLQQRQARLFGQLVMSRRGAAEAAYGTVTTSTARKDMVLIAAHRVLAGRDDALYQEIKHAVESTDKLSARRNEIAHGVVWQFQTQKRDIGYYLIPPYYNTRKSIRRNNIQKDRSGESIDAHDDEWLFDELSFCYTSSQINYYEDAFVEQASLVLELVHRTNDRCRIIFSEDE